MRNCRRHVCGSRDLPNRNCAALVLVSRTDAKLNIADERKEFGLLCPFCRSSFRASASDLVVRKVTPVWLLIRYDRGDSVAGVYLDRAERYPEPDRLRSLGLQLEFDRLNCAGGNENASVVGERGFDQNLVMRSSGMQACYQLSRRTTETTGPHCYRICRLRRAKWQSLTQPRSARRNGGRMSGTSQPR